jgi:hypothetical protein
MNDTNQLTKKPTSKLSIAVFAIGLLGLIDVIQGLMLIWNCSPYAGCSGQINLISSILNKLTLGQYGNITLSSFWLGLLSIISGIIFKKLLVEEKLARVGVILGIITILLFIPLLFMVAMFHSEL